MVTWLLAAVIAAPALGEEDGVRTLHEIAQLVPYDAAHGFGQGFGNSVAIHGDWIVVGAPGDDQDAAECGAAYVFHRNGIDWIQRGQPFKLTGLGISDQHMGFSVAVDGDRVVVGAPDLPGKLTIGTYGVGRVYVFHRENNATPEDFEDDWWRVAAMLHPPPSHVCCNFGYSVDIEGDVIVVGSRWGLEHPGRAYAFRWNGAEWLAEGTLLAPDSLAGAGFGELVATNGDRVIVTADRDDDAGESSGSAYIFALKADTWNLEAKLLPPDGVPFERFGYSVAMYQCEALIKSGGRARLYQLDPGGPVQIGTLIPSGSSVPGVSAVTIGEGVAVLGDPSDSNLASFGGAAFVFRNDEGEWMQDVKLAASNALPGDRLGSSVAISGSYTVVGSRHAAYVFATAARRSLIDYAGFQRCFGARTTSAVSCKLFDLEPDGTVDLRNLALFLQVLRGP